MGWNGLYGFGELLVGLPIHGPVLTRGLGRVMRQIIVAAPVYDGPHGPPLKPATAIGANVFQDILHAVFAKRAFMAAYPRLGGMGRQVLGAVFADWSKLKHRQLHVKTAA